MVTIHLRPFMRKVMLVRLRVNRGMTWVQDFKNVFYAAAFFKIFGLPLEWLPGFIIVAYVFVYLLGYLDEIRGVWKIENEYTSQHLNPFFKRLDAKVSRDYPFKKAKGVA